MNQLSRPMGIFANLYRKASVENHKFKRRMGMALLWQLNIAQINYNLITLHASRNPFSCQGGIRLLSVYIYRFPQTLTGCSYHLHFFQLGVRFNQSCICYLHIHRPLCLLVSAAEIIHVSPGTSTPITWIKHQQYWMKCKKLTGGSVGALQLCSVM